MSEDLFGPAWARVARAGELSKRMPELWNAYLDGHPFDTTLDGEGDGVYILRVWQEHLPWAQISGGRSTCWFAICSCGVPAAHFPLRPEDDPVDPIAAAFGAARAPGRPPWITSSS